MYQSDRSIKLKYISSRNYSNKMRSLDVVSLFEQKIKANRRNLRIKQKQSVADPTLNLLNPLIVSELKHHQQQQQRLITTSRPPTNYNQRIEETKQHIPILYSQMGNVFNRMNRLTSGKGTARAETPNHNTKLPKRI